MADTLDIFDRRLLAALQADARQSNVALADSVHLSPSQCSRRLQALEARGIIRGYHADIAPEAIGLGVTAFVTVTLEKHGESQARAFHDAVRAVPEILECLLVTGDGDYLLRVIAPDLPAFSHLLTERLMVLPGVANLRSSIALQAVKPPAPLPVASGQGTA
jgi:Lrp/AsnC family leucine-responsive transcriptional regulator